MLVNSKPVVPFIRKTIINSRGYASKNVSHLSLYPNCEHSKLSNGLRVASEQWPGSRSTSVSLCLDVGSRFDTEEQSGISHLFEHMAFKGTSKRSAQDIEREVLDRGAYVNADTDREFAELNIHCQTKDVPWAVELLADVALNQKFDDGTVEEEKRKILNELDQEEDDLKQVVFDYMHAAAYQGTPLALPASGRPEQIAELNAEKLSRFVSNQHRAPRMILTSAGGVSHEELNKLAQQNLSSVGISYEGDQIPERSKIRYTGSELRHRDDAFPLANVILAIEGPPGDHSDTITLQVMAQLHGKWDRLQGGGTNVASFMASGFFEAGLCHSFEWFFQPYRDTSLWGVHFSSERLELKRITDLVIKELMRFCKSVTEFEVQRAKNQLKTQLLIKSQQKGLPGISKQIGYDLANYERRLPMEEIFKRIDMVNAAKVKHVGMEYIYNRSLISASFGPVEALMDFPRLNTLMYQFRI